MTIEEASERYNIPIKVLKEYESWGLCSEVKKVMGSWHYDETDIERLSLIMTLHDVGFTNEEVEHYMRLALAGVATADERLKMLLNLKDEHEDYELVSAYIISWNASNYRSTFTALPYLPCCSAAAAWPHTPRFSRRRLRAA